MRITAAAAQPQIFPLTVAGAKGRKEAAELAVPARLIQTWPALASLEGAPAYNVGRAYAAFAADMANGTHTVPDFADAVRRHEVIAAIESSASSNQPESRASNARQLRFSPWARDRHRDGPWARCTPGTSLALLPRGICLPAFCPTCGTRWTCIVLSDGDRMPLVEEPKPYAKQARTRSMRKEVPLD